MAENPLMMVLHGVLIGVVLFFGMTQGLGQSQDKAMARSVLLGTLATAYMVVYGHELPSTVNPNLL